MRYPFELFGGHGATGIVSHGDLYIIFIFEADSVSFIGLGYDPTERILMRKVGEPTKAGKWPPMFILVSKLAQNPNINNCIKYTFWIILVCQ